MSIIQRGRFDFPQMLAKFNVVKKTQLPKVLANIAKNHFLEGFKKGGFQTDASKSGWRARKAGARRSGGRNILIDSGQMRASIKVQRADFNAIIIGIRRGEPSSKYAWVHNDGTGRMPQREFIGNSQKLNIKLMKTIDVQMLKIMK